MAKEIKLPQMGQTMEEGTIVNALVKEGDRVKKGDCLFEVETDKATLELESPAEGFVKKILISVGSTVPVNTPIMILGDEHEEISQSYIDSLVAGVPVPEILPKAAVSKTAQTAAPVVSEPQAGRVFASPRARAAASELGADLSSVRPAEGAVRITESDVRSFAGAQAAGAAIPAAGQKLRQIPVNRLQRITSQKMLQSKRDIPCFYLTSRVDVTDMVSLREKMNETSDVKISFNDFLIRAAAMALRQFPRMTGQLAGDVIMLSEKIDIGLAISTDQGLIAPLVKDADRKNIPDIARYCKALIARTKADALTLEDLEGGCITISNLGGFGIDSFIPIVVPGQCSILGVGKITDTCLPLAGNIMVRKLMNLTLSVDHKVANGSDAAQFLDFIEKLLENPATLK